MVQDLRAHFLAGINLIESELNAYSSNEHLWKTDKEIKNSAGNLILHLEGNLRHFIGHIMGGSSYIRQRELEFSRSNVNTDELRHGLELTKSEINAAFDKLNNHELDHKYPVELMNREWTNQQFLLHLLGHLHYHIGQINYHRRLIS